MRDRNPEAAQYFLNAYELSLAPKAVDSEKALMKAVAKLPPQQVVSAYQYVSSKSGSADVVVADVKARFPELDDSAIPVGRDGAAPGEIRPNKIAAQRMFLRADGFEVTRASCAGRSRPDRARRRRLVHSRTHEQRAALGRMTGVPTSVIGPDFRVLGDQLAEPLGQVQEASNRITFLQNAGWNVRDQLRTVSLASPQTDRASDLHDSLLPLIHLATEPEVRSKHGFRLVLVGSAFEVTGYPSPVEDYYDGAALELARSAADGDASAALLIPDRWAASMTVDLARPLQLVVPLVAWRACRNAGVVVNALRSIPWWNIGELLRAAPPTVCVVLDPARIKISTATFAVCNATSLSELEFEDIGPIETRVSSAAATALPKGICLPEELMSRGANGGTELALLLGSYAAATAWARLANSVSIIDETTAALEFFGFQRIRISIGRLGLTDPNAQRASIAMYTWATADVSPDRMLAIRQVVSMYGGERVLRSADDVVYAAEPVYRALRSASVAEAFAANRQARQLAADAARSSSDGALAAAKAVTERTIAALGAIGVLVITRAATTALPHDAFAQMSGAVAIVMLALAAWSIFIEGPAIATPLQGFLADVDKISELLSENQIDAVRNLNVVHLAGARVRTVRIAAPIAYLAVALVAGLLSR